MKSMKYKRRKAKFRAWWNRNWVLPGIIFKKVIVPENHIEQMYMRMWNIATSVPLNDHSQRQELMIECLNEIKDIYWEKGRQEMYSRIKEFNERG